MSFVSTLLKKFRISRKKVTTTPDTNLSIWNHNLPSSSSENDVKFDEKLQKYECLQKKVQQEQESRKERRTLRRQNRFLGFQNELLVAQNQRLASDKHNLKVERQVMSAKKEQIARKLRKQKRISEYYRRKLAEVRQMEKVEQKEEQDQL